MSTRLDLENPFWAFSCAVYALPGVQAACLDLQDRHGADVNLLLFAAWVGAVLRHGLMSADLATAPGGDWHGQVIVPLRALRRHVKAAMAAQAGLEGVYQQAKQCELSAEQVRQALLFQWAEARFQGRGGRSTALANLLAVMGREPSARQELQLLADAAQRTAAGT